MNDVDALDRRRLEHAARLALRGHGEAEPNPSVGCVIADAAGRVVAEGRTERVGGPHAEVVALRAAGDAARGGTAWVTLEPCNHHGRTPPCVDAMIDAGVARIVIGTRDPNPVAAGGLDRLRAAGVEVEVLLQPRRVQRRAAARRLAPRVALGVELLETDAAASRARGVQLARPNTSLRATTRRDIRIRSIAGRVDVHLNRGGAVRFGRVGNNANRVHNGERCCPGLARRGGRRGLR